MTSTRTGGRRLRPSNAFSGCNSLTSITISDNVASIGSDTFYECDSLTIGTIPDSVIFIGGYVFYKCPGNLTLTVGRDSYAAELPIAS